MMMSSLTLTPLYLKNHTFSDHGFQGNFAQHLIMVLTVYRLIHVQKNKKSLLKIDDFIVDFDYLYPGNCTFLDHSS